MRLQNPLLRGYLQKDAYQISSQDKRFIYQILGMIRHRAGQVSQREAYNRGTIMVSLPLKKGISKGIALDIDTSTEDIAYRQRLIGLGEDRTKYMLTMNTENTSTSSDDTSNQRFNVSSESIFSKDSDGKAIQSELHYMWTLASDHDYAHPDICDELAGRVYKGEDINSKDVTKPHLHCKCSMTCMESNPMSNYSPGATITGKGKDEDANVLKSLIGTGVDRGLDATENILSTMGPEGKLLALGLNLGQDVISDFLTDSIYSLVDESAVWKELNNIINTVNSAIELNNTFTSASNLYDASEILMSQDITQLGSKLKNKVINDSKDKLNKLLLDNVKMSKELTDAKDIISLYEGMNDKFNSATKLSDGIDILNDSLDIADKLGINTNKYINKKMINSTKSTVVFTEDTISNLRGTGIILF